MATNTPSTGRLRDLAGLDVLHGHARDRLGILGAGDFLQHRIPDHLDLGVLEQPLLHDALGPEAVAPMHDGDLAGEVGEEQRLLDRGVAAAEHGHLLALVEEAVAGGAGRYAVPLELLLRRQAEPARLGAGGDDQRIAGVDVAGVALQPERPARQVHAGDVVHDELGADVRRLRLHLLHQPGALDDLGEARIVLDVGGDGHLPARLHTLDDHRFQHCTGCIDGGRVAGRTGAEDDKLGVLR